MIVKKTINGNEATLTLEGWLDVQSAPQFEDSLKVKQYQRDLYNAIAVIMYPLFMENPPLWKMILNIGDIRSWTSLEDLFSHLEATADDSFRESLSRLRRMFS